MPRDLLGKKIRTFDAAGRCLIKSTIGEAGDIDTVPFGRHSASVRTVIADHGEWLGPEHWIVTADLAGGSMPDLGADPVALVIKILGRPRRVLAYGAGASSGVNGQASMLLVHPNGAQSVSHTGILGHTPGDAICRRSCRGPNSRR